jgi:uncharacterized protein YdaU (DUF1376 family)
MAKDPAFLFYSKDWIEGTAEMMHDEKGVFIDLLAHHHQSGSLPVDTKRLALIARLSHEEFLRIWNNGLSKKFEPDGNRLVNRKLTEVVTERLTVAKKNRISGIFAGLVRTSKLSQIEKENIKKAFKIDDFIDIPTDRITERLTDWFTDRLPSLGNGNGNGNINEEKEEGTEGGKEVEHFRRSNVKTTDDQHAKLAKEFGEEIRDTAYAFLSDYKIEKNYKTKSDYLTIRRWVIKAVTEKPKSNASITPAPAAKLGTSAARVEALRNW